MTISTDACLAIHVVYNDGALFVPRHVRFWQYHQQRPSLANSLNVVVANQRLVLAMTNSGYTVQNQYQYTGNPRVSLYAYAPVHEFQTRRVHV